jgi:protein AroM
MATVGLVTIGQTPRDDIVPAMTAALPPEHDILEAGVLDDLTPDEIAGLAPSNDDEVVVTRLRDGTEVSLAKRAIIERIQTRIDELDDRVDVHVLLCTGAYPTFAAAHRVIDADQELFDAASRLHGGGGIGVLIPTDRQRASTLARWSELDARIEVGVASPYAPELRVQEVTNAFANARVELVVMSCLGYTESMREIVTRTLDVPVLLPSTVVMSAALRAIDLINHNLAEEGVSWPAPI